MGPVLAGLLMIVVTLLAVLIRYAIKATKYWEERGVPYVKPVLFFGNTWKVTLQLATIAENQKAICDHFPNEPMVGYYDFLKPVLLIKDPHYAEKVLIKDFPNFMDRGVGLDEESNPLDYNLSIMTGKRWRALRNKLSPVFTTGKLRIMYEQMLTLGDTMKEVLDEENLKGIELKDILGRFAMDVIGSCAFGIDPGNLVNGDSEFRRMGIKSFSFSGLQFLKFLVFLNFPTLSKKLKLSFSKKDVRDYFCGIIKETVQYRKTQNVRRNDFIDLMLQLQEKGHVEIKTKDPEDEYLGIEDHYTTDTFEITDDNLTAQAFIFLTAGFEATAATINFACYELSKNISMQEKARKEILDKIKENSGKLDFDSLKQMHYLEMCVKETMRMYAPAPFLMRSCTKEYTFPNGYTINPGESVQFAISAIHFDPAIYSEPDKFEPERFAPDKFLPPASWLAFGDGPRVCIAMRFALLQIKFAVAKILANYSLKINAKTKEPLQFTANAMLTSTKYPIYFDLEKVK